MPSGGPDNEFLECEQTLIIYVGPEQSLTEHPEHYLANSYNCSLTAE